MSLNVAIHDLSQQAVLSIAQFREARMIDPT